MSNTEKLSTVEVGNPRGELLFFMAGFPDDCMSAWAPLVEQFKENNRLVLMCMPDYDRPELQKKWGYTFDEIVQRMDNTISDIAGSAKVTLITHDWGAVIGLMYANKYPLKLKKLVSIDIGADKGTPAIKDQLIIAFYTAWFAISFILSQTIHNTIGDIFMFIFLGVLARFIGPLYPTERVPRKRQHVHAYMCYPYYHAWKKIITTRSLRMTRPAACPVLFVYGTEKRAMFHTTAYLEHLRNTPGSQAVSLKCGHWAMQAMPEELARVITEFLSS